MRFSRGSSIVAVFKGRRKVPSSTRTAIVSDIPHATEQLKPTEGKALAWAEITHCVEMTLNRRVAIPVGVNP